MRYFERLPGQVDVQLISDNNWDSLYDGESMFAIPICTCTPLDKFQEAMIQSLHKEKKQNENEQIESLVNKINKYVKEMDFKVYTDYAKLKADFIQLKASAEELTELLEEEIDDEELVDEAHVIFTFFWFWMNLIMF